MQLSKERILSDTMPITKGATSAIGVAPLVNILILLIGETSVTKN